MAAAAGFWNRMAARYARSAIADEASYQTKLEITRRYFTPKSSVFEFGCGTGSTAILHAPFVGEILATDFSANMLEIARTRAEEAGVKNLTFSEAGIDEYDAGGQVFDVVMAMSVLHLVEDRDAVIAKVFSMVKPGGVFITSTACLGDWLKIIRYVAPIGRMVGLLPVLRVFSTMELKRSMEQAGFQLVEEFHPGRKKALFLVVRKPE
jgi:2-polyprenyl-3-methyl-5-hydroxy-6-metoxy-1,4-benzoquinol methylase